MEDTWISEAEIKRVMERPDMLTASLGKIRRDKNLCHKMPSRNRGSSGDWQISVEGLAYLLKNSKIFALRMGEAADAFLQKYGLDRSGNPRLASPPD